MMRNRIRLWEAMRSIAVVALVAIIGFTMTACGDDNPNNSVDGSQTEELPECDCIDTVHPYSSPCACPAEGTSACNCTTAEPQILTVTFDADDGSAVTTIDVTEGGKAIKPPDPEKDEYGFEYWYNVATNLEWNFNTAVTANITLKAKWFHQSLYMEMVYVGGGTFEMGDDNGDDEYPAHNVTLTGFYIGKYEITQKQWETVMGWVYAYPSTGEGDNYPVYDICWYETLEFCNRLSILEGLNPAYIIKGETNPDEWGDYYEDWEAWENVSVVYGSNGYRLPTEAQWEYAAKGGHLASKPYYTYSGSNNANEVANVGGSLMPVGSKNPNQLGLYDMSGNVFEWCWDWYDDEYYWEAYLTPMPNPSGPFSGEDLRVIRGGSYRASKYAPSIERLGWIIDEWEDSIGFRVARPAY